jgi:HAD superfamily hydrolase (TIGR01509 family)
MAGISAVIFDMDGVIIDSEPIHMKIEQEMFRELGISLSEKEQAGFVGTTSLHMWETLVERFGLSWSPELLRNRERAQYMRYLDQDGGASPVEGAVDLVKSLYASGYILVLASSSSQENISKVLDHFAISSYFQIKVSGTLLPQSKPHPAIFLRAAALAGVSPNTCVVIEDAENGVKAAKAAGMVCIGFLNPNSGNQDLTLADKVIHRLDEITPSFIERIVVE